MPRPHYRILLTTLGLAACAALGTSLLSAPASSAASKAAGPPTPAQLSAQAVAARQHPLLEVANEIIQLTGQGRAPGYSGYGDVAISVPNRLVTLYWHGPLPSALRLQLVRLRATAPVQVVAAPYTWQELEAQTHQIAAHQAGLRADGYTLARVGPEPGATGLQVGVDYARSRALATGPAAASLSAQAASAQAAVRRLVPGPAPVRISNTPLAHAAGTRNVDASPWWGGSRIVRPGNIDCSSGFSVVRGSTHYMVTAGHCGGINTPWQTGDFYGSGNVMGTETARNPCCDSAVIKVGSNQGHIYDKAWNSSTGEAVIGPLTAVVGTLVCDEGATSGVRCNINTVATGLVVDFTNEDGSTFTAENESQGFQIGGTQATAGGDSGGPVIINSRTAGRIYATGTISGGYGNVSCNNIDPNVVPVCYEGVYFEEIIPILNLWTVNLVTG
jgi:hypothetical protein